MRTGTCCLLQGPHWREKHLQPAWSSGCCQGPPGTTCTSVVPSGSFGTLSLPVLPAPFLADGQTRTSTGATLMGRRGHTRWVCAEPHRPWCLDRAGEGHQGVSWAPPHLHRAPHTPSNLCSLFGIPQAPLPRLLPLTSAFIGEGTVLLTFPHRPRGAGAKDTPFQGRKLRRTHPVAARPAGKWLRQN